MKKTFIIILLFLSLSFLHAQKLRSKTIIFLPGSNIYIRVFMFYFPFAKDYEVYLNLQEDNFNVDLLIEKDNIKNEPFTPSYFDSEVLVSIKNLPYLQSGRFKLPISIRCNKKYINREIEFAVYFEENILIINGAILDLSIEEITENKYFKKRFKWKYPLYFDIRLQLHNKLVNEIKEISEKAK